MQIKYTDCCNLDHEIFDKKSSDVNQDSNQWLKLPRYKLANPGYNKLVI